MPHMSHSTRINDASHVASHVYRMAHHMCTSDVSHGALRVHHLSYRMCCVTPAQPNTAASRSPGPRCVSCSDTLLCVTPARTNAAASRSPGPSLRVMRRHIVMSHQHKRMLLLRASLAPRCVSCNYTSLCVTPAQTNASVSRSPRPSLCVTRRHTPTMFPRAPLASLRAVCHT